MSLLSLSSPFLIFLLVISVLSCSESSEDDENDQAKNEFHRGTFGYDREFLSNQSGTILLQNGDAQVLLSTAYQGRVMTSTTGGDAGYSNGWLNYELIESRKFAEHISVFGGEDRFWLGPEGGQFSIYFQPKTEFTFENWYVPKEIDQESFDLVNHSSSKAHFQKDIQLLNYSGHTFQLKVDRTIQLLDDKTIEARLGFKPSERVKSVAFESINSIKNTGETTWNSTSGMLSVWILGMFNPSESTTIILPFKEGPESEFGPIVNDTYFGKIPEDRLVVRPGILFFKGDGKLRSKLGISPQRALPFSGSYDAKNKVLTLVSYSLPAGAERYVNSMWEIQDEPFKGDAVNSYNDGPLDDGSQMGPFYELESSSPAADLAPNDSLTHIHSTYHFEGNEGDLSSICEQILGVSLKEVVTIFMEK